MSIKTSSNPTKFTRVVSGNTGLSALLAQARDLGRLRAELAGSLPEELREGWQLARLDARMLVVTVDGPARATRMRYAQAALLHAAQVATGTRPSSMRVKIIPPVRKPPPAEPRRLSTEAAALLQSTAAGVEDEKLKRALLRLAQRA